MRFIDKLAVLGGAELALLRLVPTALGQFVQFALVLLGTALMAAVSMWFALVQGLKVNPLLAVPFAVLWGLLILNLDRYLTTSMQSTSSFRQALGMTIPRVLMAALIGVVVSTPLVLKVFESDINAQMGAGTPNDQGILAQLRALFMLGETNPLMGAAHWAIGALVFTSLLLPVIVKLLLNSGPLSLYEQVKKRRESGR